jgi:hypothetical protein
MASPWLARNVGLSPAEFFNASLRDWFLAPARRGEPAGVAIR